MEIADGGFLAEKRFQIKSRLGQGGMGVVYKAFDRKNQEMVALKTLSHCDANAILRFDREFFALKEVDHPNLVKLKEFFELKEQRFFSMELVEGVDFFSYVMGKGKAFSEERLRESLRQLAEGITVLHRHGKVHRDLKPSNILVTANHRIVIMDLGLVTDVIGGRQLADIEAIGTSVYMSPEQSVGLPVGAAADWYSVGVVLYHLLTGRLPYEGSNEKILVDKQMGEPPPPSHHAGDLPVDLESLCIDLLRFDAKLRPNSREIFERLGLEYPFEEVSALEFKGAEIYEENIPFCGRSRELDRLQEIFAARGEEQVTSVLLVGEPGIGKTALAEEFFRQARKKDEDLALVSGRCLQNSTRRFQAFDKIVAELGVKFGQLTANHRWKIQVDSILTREEASALIQVFPQLKSIRAIIDMLDIGDRRQSPQQVRLSAFGAVRKMLCCVAKRYPLIVFIDDVQWAEQDSLDLFQEVISSDEKAPLFLIGTFRVNSPMPLSVEKIFPNLITLSLDSLLQDDIVELAQSLCGMYGLKDLSGENLALFTREAGGHPLFLAELIRHHAMSLGEQEPVTRLEDALLARIRYLSEPERQMLELISLAGIALDYETLADAAGVDTEDCIRNASRLIAHNLVRSQGEIGDERLEPYHDRVHETVVPGLDEETRKKHHRNLAWAMNNAASEIDLEIVAQHLEEAGSHREAGRMAAKAAKNSLDRLAFGRAVDLLHTALRLGDFDQSERRKILMTLGDTLCNIGRGTEASEMYLAARQGADIATSFGLQRRAAEQLVIAGHFKEGIEELRSLIKEIGEKFSLNSIRTIASLLWNRAILAFRGMRWRAVEESGIDQKELAKLDIYGFAAEIFSMVDNVKGLEYQTRRLLTALRLGERRRIGDAIVLEVPYVAVAGNARAFKQARSLIKRAKDIATEYDLQDLKIDVVAVRGSLRYFKGYLQEAYLLLSKAEEDLVRSTNRSDYRLNTARLFLIYLVRFMGDYEQLETMTKRYLRDAARRGDKYMEANMRYLRSPLWLVRDLPGEGTRDLEVIKWTPPEGRYHLQHWYSVSARIEIALYQSVDPEQLPGFEKELKALSRSLLLRIGVIRAELFCLWGRVLVAFAAMSEGSVRKRLLRQANKMAGRISAKKTGFRPADIWTLLLRGAIAYQRGEGDRGATFLRSAIGRSEEMCCPHLAASAERRLGQILGGTEGAALLAKGDQWMKQRGIGNVESMTDLLVPGFPIQKRDDR